jgi:hypothetical protein
MHGAMSIARCAPEKADAEADTDVRSWERC